MEERREDVGNIKKVIKYVLVQPSLQEKLMKKQAIINHQADRPRSESESGPDT